MKKLIRNIPILGSIARYICRRWINRPESFSGSKRYWINRYESEGNSGDGSYNKLAEFKAEILNEFVQKNAIKSIIEYGSGDGNQLRFAKYPNYTGFDVSSQAISMCKEIFLGDETKVFKMMEVYSGETAELTLSLDVIYHLIEDDVFCGYMNRLFDSSKRFVIIYSSDTEDNLEGQAAHVRHRRFTKWIKSKKPGWKLLTCIPNRYPFTGNTKVGSHADFFIYEKTT